MIVSGAIYKIGDSKGLPDVNVFEVGTSNSTRTDANGNFTINVTSGMSLIRFTRLDVVTKEIVANEFINFENLEPNTTELPEANVNVLVKKPNLTPLWIALGLVGALSIYAIYEKNKKPQPTKVKV